MHHIPLAHLLLCRRVYTWVVLDNDMGGQRQDHLAPALCTPAWCTQLPRREPVHGAHHLLLREPVLDANNAFVAAIAKLRYSNAYEAGCLVHWVCLNNGDTDSMHNAARSPVPCCAMSVRSYRVPRGDAHTNAKKGLTAGRRWI